MGKSGSFDFTDFDEAEQDPLELLAIARSKLKESEKNKKKERAKAKPVAASPAPDGPAEVPAPAPAKPAEAPIPPRSRRAPATAPAAEISEDQPAEPASAKPVRRRQRKVKVSTDGRSEVTPPAASPVTTSLSRLVGIGAAVAVLAASVLIALCAFCLRSPAPLREIDAIVFAGDEVPFPMQKELVTTFPAIEELFRHPGDHLLHAFAVHLGQHPSVAKVRDVSLTFQRNEDGQADRAVRVVLDLRRAILPILLADGQRAWVDGQGAVISGILPGPEDAPEVVHLEEAAPGAIAEVLAAWPKLKERLPKGHLARADLHAPLGRPGQNGIVFHTRDGVRLVWGAPDEGRFGVSADEKIANAVHAVRNFSRVGEVNLRFHRPYGLVAASR